MNDKKMFHVKYGETCDDSWYSSFGMGLTATEIINEFAKHYDYTIGSIRPDFTGNYLVAYGVDEDKYEWCFIVNKIEEDF